MGILRAQKALKKARELLAGETGATLATQIEARVQLERAIWEVERRQNVAAEALRNLAEKERAELVLELQQAGGAA